MSPEKTSKNPSPGPASKRRTKVQKLSKAARLAHEASTEGRSTMHSDPFHPVAAADPQDGTAVIQPVTAEALDDVAHKAAELADGVAHHTIAAADIGNASEDPIDVAAADAAETVQETGTSVVTEIDKMTPPEASDAPEPVSRSASAGRTGPEATLARYNDRVLEIMQDNLAASTALLSALSQAKSLPEAVAINTDHMRRQLDAMTSQGRELASLAQRFGLDALKPFAGLLQRGR